MITHDDLAKLQAPFPVNEHEFLNGYVYIQEESVCQRIESVDPSWSTTEPEVMDRIETFVNDKTGETKSMRIVSVKMGVTINGITRWGIGSASVTSLTSEAEKSAITDALKRASRLHGIGRYLLSAKGIKTHAQLATWLGTPLKPAQDAPPTTQSGTKAEAPKQPQNAPKTVAKHWIDDDASRKKFWAYTQNDLGLAQVDVYLALGVSSLHDFTGTKEQAVSMLHAYVGEMATSKKEVYN